MKFIGAYYNGIPISYAFWDRGVINFQLEPPQEVYIDNIFSSSVLSTSLNINAISINALEGYFSSVSSTQVDVSSLSVVPIDTSSYGSTAIYAQLDSKNVDSISPQTNGISSHSLTLDSLDVSTLAHRSGYLSNSFVNLEIYNTAVFDIQQSVVQCSNLYVHPLQCAQLGELYSTATSSAYNSLSYASAINADIYTSGVSSVIGTLEVKDATSPLSIISGEVSCANVNLSNLTAVSHSVLSYALHSVNIDVECISKSDVDISTYACSSCMAQLTAWEKWILVTDNEDGSHSVYIYRSFTQPSSSGDGDLDLTW